MYIYFASKKKIHGMKLDRKWIITKEEFEQCEPEEEDETDKVTNVHLRNRKLITLKRLVYWQLLGSHQHQRSFWLKLWSISLNITARLDTNQMIQWTTAQPTLPERQRKFDCFYKQQAYSGMCVPVSRRSHFSICWYLLTWLNWSLDTLISALRESSNAVPQ